MRQRMVVLSGKCIVVGVYRIGSGFTGPVDWHPTGVLSGDEIGVLLGH